MAGRLVQTGHVMLADAVHTDAMYWPVLQTPQVVGAVTPWTQKLLAGHASWTVVFGQKEPAAQRVCFVELAGQ